MKKVLRAFILLLLISALLSLSGDPLLPRFCVFVYCTFFITKTIIVHIKKGASITNYFIIKVVIALVLMIFTALSFLIHKDETLTCAISYRYNNFAKLMVYCGANVNTKDKSGNPLLSNAIYSQNIEIISWLVLNGVDLNSKNKDGLTPLMVAAFWGNEKLIKLLIDYGSNTEAKDNYGATPLMYALLNRKTENALLLLNYKTDINMADTHGRTPLTIASANGQTGIVKRLLFMGADLNVKEVNGKTALDLAKEYKYAEIVLILTEYSVSNSIK